jgi:hypothetical protein
VSLHYIGIHTLSFFGTDMSLPWHSLQPAFHTYEAILIVLRDVCNQLRRSLRMHVGMSIIVKFCNRIDILDGHIELFYVEVFSKFLKYQ